MTRGYGSEDDTWLWLSDVTFLPPPMDFIHRVIFNKAVRFGRQHCFCLQARKTSNVADPLDRAIWKTYTTDQVQKKITSVNHTCQSVGRSVSQPASQ